MASSDGLVVKAEDSWLRGRGFKPPTEETIFHLDQKPGAIIELN
jgi:hypothetical protein